MAPQSPFWKVERIRIPGADESKILQESQRKAKIWDFPDYKNPELKTEIEKDLPKGKAVMVNDAKRKRAEQKFDWKGTREQVLQEYVRLGGLIKYPNLKKKYHNIIGYLYK